MPTIICPHCGTANRSGSNFCNSCGTDLRGAEGKMPTSGQPLGDESSRGRSPGSIEAAARRAAARMAGVEPNAGEQEARSAEKTGAAESSQEPPARPMFDLGLASPGFGREAGAGSAEDDAEAATGADTPDVTAGQPWLQGDPDEDAPPGAPTSQEGAGGRLIMGVQGLLAPLSTTRIGDSDQGPAAQPDPGRATEISSDLARRIRLLMGDDPVLAHQADGARPWLPRPLRSGWIFWVIGLAVGLPVLLLIDRPAGTPQLWPGVAAAYAAVDRLPPTPEVLIFWAYDPATAGELDLAAQPVLQHLLERRARLSVVSLLPNGPATARRLLARAWQVQQESGTPVDPLDSTVRFNRFLPGGASVLPLLAGPPTPLVTGRTDLSPRPDPDASLETDLVIVMAAQAEDVQAWLELVQPQRNRPVVAVTSAAVDPMVRPYLDSGQLVGLVSGFDGAAGYRALRNETTTQLQSTRLYRHMQAQDWGMIALLGLLLLGNLAGLLGRRGGE